MSSRLHKLERQIESRSEQIISKYGDWPCRKGCADCCRSLASVPRLTRAEWQRVQKALERLPAGTADIIRQRIQDSAAAAQPIVCPMLDRDSGICLVYEGRPIACRAYGFYAEREKVLGCSRIESIARQDECEVVWGNHRAIEEDLDSSEGEAFELHEWQESTAHSTFSGKETVSALPRIGASARLCEAE